MKPTKTIVDGAFGMGLGKVYGIEDSNKHLSVCLFSSRRRHTRFDCDWSSDVCSSDLDQEVEKDCIAMHKAGLEENDKYKFRPANAKRAQFTYGPIELFMRCVCAMMKDGLAEIGRASCRERV